jgi:DNA-binding transcriptional LysR family regulator
MAGINMELVYINKNMLSPQHGHEGKGKGKGARRNARMYDRRKFHITLKQWRMLHAVIDCDGFTAAAEYLHVSQSAISYTIAKMQEQLGILLLRVEGRKTHVTGHGRALLEHSRNMLRSAIELETLAERMRLGWEPELRLMVDHDCPQTFLMRAIRAFTDGAPGVQVSLLEGFADELEQAIGDGTVDLAVHAHVLPGLVAERLVTVEYAAVVHPAHALAQCALPLRMDDLARHTRIAVDKPRGGRGKPAQPSHMPPPWRVSSFDTALAALEACLGYAWLPLERVRRFLDAGSLVRLQLADVCHNTRDFYLVQARNGGGGIGIDSLSGLLQAHAAQQTEAA